MQLYVIANCAIFDVNTLFKMVQFSVDDITVDVSFKEPTLFDRYKKDAVLVDINGLQKGGTAVYVIVKKGNDPQKFATVIIAFKTDPVGYAGFYPSVHYASDTKVLFIGAGSVVKIVSLEDYKIIFEKDFGFGFWGWGRHQDFVVYQEETDFGVFNLLGEHLWGVEINQADGPEIKGDMVTIIFDHIVTTRLLATGEIISSNYSL